MTSIEINIVIGSWGSYNACNAKTLGSKWLNLADYSDWDEIQTELEQEGFELNGIDEELFIQCIDEFGNAENWDFVHPKSLFETLQSAGVLEDEYKYRAMKAYLEVCNYSEFFYLVERHGSQWDDDVRIFEGYNWEDYGRMMLENTGYELPDELQCHFDYYEYGESFSNYNVYSYSEGIIEIYG